MGEPGRFNLGARKAEARQTRCGMESQARRFAEWKTGWTTGERQASLSSVTTETQEGIDAARAAIRKVVEDWVLLRDAGRWDDFRSVWHDDGWMTATWFQGPFDKFIEASRSGFEDGVEISHFLGGFTCEIRGDRAIAQTKMKIEQRGVVDGITVDVTCAGRFYDFLARRQGAWRLTRRQPIYERDRLDVLDPSAVLKLDPDRLASLPRGYRHLGYVQEANGNRVLRGLPGLRGPEIETLYAEGRGWLDGSLTPGVPLQHRD
jgi:hypothetical protein